MDIQTIILWATAASVVVSALTRLYMQSVFKRYMGVFSKKNWTGVTAVRHIFEKQGFENVEIVRREGVYNDRYIPALRTMMVSSGAWGSRQIVAISALLFEAMKAVLYKKGFGVCYAIRRWMFNLLQILSWVSLVVLAVLPIIGRFDLVAYPVSVYLLNFLVVVMFLPLDFLSARLAKKSIEQNNIFLTEELKVVKSALRACTLTYLASSYKIIYGLISIGKNLIFNLIGHKKVGEMA